MGSIIARSALAESGHTLDRDAGLPRFAFDLPAVASWPISDQLEGRHPMRRFLITALVGLLLATVAAVPASAVYPGANGRIAYLLENGDGFLHIWTANPDLSDPSQLTFGAFSTWDEAWSADGQKLVFSTDRYATAPPPEPGFRVDIVTMNVATGQQAVLTTGGISEQPSFSPDGTRILFAKTDPVSGLGQGLFTIRASDGADLRKVTKMPQGVDFLQWPRYSPDGSRIAFTAVQHAADRQSGRASGTGAIYVVNADGTGLRRMTPFGHLFDYEVDWSPDGTQLVFQTNWRPGTRPSLWIMNADGSDLRRLTDESPLAPGQPFQASFAPTWAPDGSVIMFACAAGALSFWDLCAIRPDGSGRALVASTPGDEHRPMWQPVP
jgi:TolB protein